MMTIDWSFTSYNNSYSGCNSYSNESLGAFCFIHISSIKYSSPQVLLSYKRKLDLRGSVKVTLLFQVDVNRREQGCAAHYERNI